MNINKISASTNFKSDFLFPPKTFKRDCVDIISGANSDFIKQLDNFGLINRGVLNQYQSYMEKEKQFSCENSINTIAKIIDNPEFSVEKLDNGYFYTIESPYNYKETVEGYAKGESYNTLKFNQAYQFSKHLNNLSQNGSLHHAIKLMNLLQKSNNKKVMDNINKVVQGNKLQVCQYKKDNSFGILTLQSPSAFISNSLIRPIIQTVRIIRNNLPQQQQLILNDYIFDMGYYSALTKQSVDNIQIG